MQNDQQNMNPLLMKLAQDRAALVNDMMQQDMQMPDEAIIATNKRVYLSMKQNFPNRTDDEIRSAMIASIITTNGRTPEQAEALVNEIMNGDMQNDQQNIDQADPLLMKPAQDRAALANDMMQMPDEAIIATNKRVYLSMKQNFPNRTDDEIRSAMIASIITINRRTPEQAEALADKIMNGENADLGK